MSTGESIKVLIMYLNYSGSCLCMVLTISLVECSVVGAHGQTKMPHFQPGIAPGNKNGGSTTILMYCN